MCDAYGNLNDDTAGGGDPADGGCDRGGGYPGNSIKLLNHFDIHTPMTSYEYNKVEKAHQLVGQLLNGQNIALITDDAVPAISDPGEVLVRMPGAERSRHFSAGSGSITALTLSGLSTKVLLKDFCPADKRKRK